MSIKAPQVLIFVACAAGMVGVLSILRIGFRDQADEAFWNRLSGAGEEVAEMRAEEAEKLASGPLSIEQAKAQLAAKGRHGFVALKSESGEGVPPVAGWVHHPRFEERAAAAKDFTEQRTQPEAEQAEGAEATEAEETEPAAAAE